MKQTVSVYNSDSINLYGSRFTVGALFLNLLSESIRGIPILVSHDASRLIGWSRPLALYFEPGLTRLVGIGEMPENADDFDYLQKLFVHRLHEDLDDFQSDIDELRETLHDLLQGQEKLIRTECVALVESGLARNALPELFALEDKDGLIPIKHLNPLGPGVFQVGDLAIFAHKFFRRSMYLLNTLNYPFLQNLQSLKADSVKISLDPDMVGLASTYTGGREELIYWWGPRFDDDLRSISVGVSHHEAEETDRLFFGISATQFRWGNINNHKVFEAEELRDIPTVSPNKQKYGCRYVHSMVSKEEGQVEHLDGSIRMYSEDDMLKRLDVDLAHAERNTEYTKLWRIDDMISISVWKRLLTDFFRDNFLVGEYLGAEKPSKTILSTEKEEETESYLEEYVPFTMTPDMGVRIALSIHPRTDESIPNTREVKPLDRIGDHISQYPCVETFTLELRKILARSGESLFIPTGTRYISFKDFYINLPLIVHSEVETQESIIHTLEAIKEIVDEYSKKAEDWVLSYTFSFPLDKDREVRISTLGHVNSLASWFENPLSRPPITDDGLHEWSEKIVKYLKNTFHEFIDHPRIFKVFMNSGILLISRKRIETQDFQIEYSEELKSFEYKLNFDEESKALVSKLFANGVQPSFAFLIEKSECSRCGDDYSICNCSKLFDPGVTQIIIKAIPFPFWTDRPLFGLTH